MYCIPTILLFLVLLIALQSKSEAVLAGLMFGFLISFVLNPVQIFLTAFAKIYGFYISWKCPSYVYCISSYSKIDNLIPHGLKQITNGAFWSCSQALVDKKTLPLGVGVLKNYVVFLKPFDPKFVSLKSRFCYSLFKCF